MVRSVKGLCLLSLVLAAGGCTFQAPVVPPQGFIYSNVSAPIDTNADKTAVSSKSGSSTSTSYFFRFFAMGDSSLDSAARAGGLTEITSADYHYTNYMFMFEQFTVIAHGN